MSQDLTSIPCTMIVNEAFPVAEEPHSFTTYNYNGQQLVIAPQQNQIAILGESESTLQSYELIQGNSTCIVQIVHPQELNLSSPVTLRRGRPRKKQRPQEPPTLCPPNTNKLESSEAPKNPRTRSGRLVKAPRYIETDFESAPIPSHDIEPPIADDKTSEGAPPQNLLKEPEFIELQTRKRTISAQYRCPKCLKAYMGKNKIIQHLKKYPDHGPFPETAEQLNFDVWNYLFDITQRCKSGNRGAKFCEELSNLLHNVQLLKSALFKTVTDSKNCVQIDKVLGNAIGLAPGKYKFDENELYKDVTVLKLITNSEFFKPNVGKTENLTTKPTDEIQKPVTNSPDKDKIEQVDSPPLSENKTSFMSTLSNNSKDSDKDGDIVMSEDLAHLTLVKKDTGALYNFQPPTNDTSQPDKPVTELPIFAKKMEETRLSLHSDLENSLLNSLTHPRNAVDELMLSGVDNGSNLLDNSTSSDEVMNVDQFVNERFKKIIEPDIDIDLPTLEYFNFSAS